MADSTVTSSVTGRRKDRAAVGLVCAVVVLALAIRSATAPVRQQTDPATGYLLVPVTLEGGHRTDAVDRGRPVALIGPALGVSPEEFRAAFRGVSPAPAGTVPASSRVHHNKQHLMSVLAPKGVTNRRLDEVSNYYRYNPRRGGLWPTRDATIAALIDGDQIRGFRILDGGSGYSSVPRILVPEHPSVAVTVELEFGPDLSRNGSITKVELARVAGGPLPNVRAP